MIRDWEDTIGDNCHSTMCCALSDNSFFPCSLIEFGREREYSGSRNVLALKIDWIRGFFCTHGTANFFRRFSNADRRWASAAIAIHHRFVPFGALQIKSVPLSFYSINIVIVMLVNLIKRCIIFQSLTKLFLRVLLSAVLGCVWRGILLRLIDEESYREKREQKLVFIRF